MENEVTCESSAGGTPPDADADSASAVALEIIEAALIAAVPQGRGIVAAADRLGDLIGSDGDDDEDETDDETPPRSSSGDSSDEDTDASDDKDDYSDLEEDERPPRDR